ncbi:hypothetical protein HOY80DRAFT_1107895 [Tuber brumale]|nr:hypothetical protein HOY80DRAFT_1107895 [Tuber brumale]
MAEAATSHIVNSTHRTLRSPHLQFLPIYLKKWSKRALTIPLNLTNIPMSGIDTDVFFTVVAPRLYVQCLRLLAELRKRLGGDWSIVQAEEERGEDELSEKAGKPPPGPAGKELPAVRERSELRAVVVGALGPYSIGKTFFRRQPIEQLWWHLNPNGRVLSIIEIGMPMGFEAVVYARSTTLKDCIQDVSKAFQSPPTKNAGGFANPPIEKEPGTTIAPCTNQEQ